MPQETLEAPQVVKESHAIWWKALIVLFIIVAIGEMVALDIFGGFNTGIMAFLAWYLVKNNCQRMTQCCVLYFGIMCGINAIFDLFPLLGSLAGRVIEHETALPVSGQQTIYTITTEKHPFFDQSQGWLYNLQSAMMIASPIPMALGAILASMTYGEYPTPLFAPEEGNEGQAFNRGQGGFGGGGQNFGGGTLGGGSAGGYGAQGRRMGAVPLFEGQGQRLGGGA